MTIYMTFTRPGDVLMSGAMSATDSLRSSVLLQRACTFRFRKCAQCLPSRSLVSGLLSMRNMHLTDM